jgi:hypothetical protein
MAPPLEEGESPSRREGHMEQSIEVYMHRQREDRDDHERIVAE